ncbi:MAG: CoB--CoM heterodisulfide reductase iron-sulfur subunit B family protein [Anaerolineae bacterium]|nr:CoB--CoM heterodisulfide reductase iron-sulfur subunit B family protein [Anaerolineae bacterium]
MRYAYYPGCSLHASAKEYDISLRAVSERLGIELIEIDDWNCCGTVHATSIDRMLALGLAARNLSIAEASGLSLAIPCSGCYKNLRTAAEMLSEDASLRARINAGLETRSYQGSTTVKHPLYIILEDVGLDSISDLPRPLQGLKVAPYYGCVLTRPAAVPPVDDPEDPQGLDRLLEALGAEVVPYPAKTKCCGGAVLLSHQDVALDLTGELLKQARRAEADCVVVVCPMCQLALDGYQSKVERRLGERIDMPILYFTQLMGLALGIDERRLGFGRLVVSPAKVLARL